MSDTPNYHINPDIQSDSMTSTSVHMDGHKIRR
jgi:hypothetical protein